MAGKTRKPGRAVILLILILALITAMSLNWKTQVPVDTNRDESIIANDDVELVSLEQLEDETGMDIKLPIGLGEGDMSYRVVEGQEAQIGFVYNGGEFVYSIKRGTTLDEITETQSQGDDSIETRLTNKGCYYVCKVDKGYTYWLDEENQFVCMVVAGEGTNQVDLQLVTESIIEVQ